MLSLWAVLSLLVYVTTDQVDDTIDSVTLSPYSTTPTPPDSISQAHLEPEEAQTSQIPSKSGFYDNKDER